MQVTHDPMIDGEDANTMQLWLKRIAIGLLALLVLGAIGYGISKLMSGGATHKKQVTTIKLLPDTPPPPPPPPPKEPPKEQPKEQPKEAPKAPEPKPAETPPAENLKMEGAAGDGPSPFAAGAVSNDYKGGDVKTIGSDGGAKFNWYAGLVKSQIENALEKDKNITQGQYKLVVNVWIKSNGDVERLDLVQSDAKDDVEQAVKAALNSMPRIREAPPEGMPQPIKLRISARKLG
ncbi:outer membrane transport energization protein TonB [Methylophilaceae bacterium 11]|uniref:TonB C-terminal domain-containing protein n=1 Tax=Methylotenera sp. 1P/1 TaxID=1131551 RepID=UPI00036D418A|nr:TonB C-terminal domain-containing protein [Methylotenera sp. 1P/1]EUJ10444.1 outer membrane transport energization protein TonB [Methylophilaceae bacterium 11]